METAAALRQRLEDEGLDPGAWSNGPGDRYGAHEHGYDKVIVVTAGSIEFGLRGTGEAVRMEVGDRLDLPAGTSHDARVGERGVTCLEAHLSAGSLSRSVLRRDGDW